MTSPFVPVSPLPDVVFARVRRRAVFDCCKWDPQVGDVSVVARYPLLITPDAWAELVPLAEALAREALAAERELVTRPELHARLGLPQSIRRALRRAANGPATPGMARLIRFDFHHTSEGWRISEANADVPGGLNEASGYPPLMAAHYGNARPVGDPAGAYARALVDAVGVGAAIALVHATSYSDDLQMMRFVADRLRAAGVAAHLASPAHLRWDHGRASLDRGSKRLALAGIVRFFPAEWLDGLPRRSNWPRLFGGGLTPVSNPPAALLIQSKRFPLVWEALRTPLLAWRRLLPETREPHEVAWRTSDEWIVKPALGRVGEDIAMKGVTERQAWRRIARQVRWAPGRWAAQRRFASSTVTVGARARYPCVGVYTLDAAVIGAYGRVAVRPLIDQFAEDAAVLVAA